MLRNFGIALLLMGLLGATFDGFRVRDRAGSSPASATQGAEEGLVHTSEASASIPPN
jgi:hypothetical protein